MKLASVAFGLPVVVVLVWTANGKIYLVKTKDHTGGGRDFQDDNDLSPDPLGSAFGIDGLTGKGGDEDGNSKAGGGQVFQDVNDLPLGSAFGIDTLTGKG